MSTQTFSLKQAAEHVQRHPATLLRWINARKVSIRKKKDSRGHWIFTADDVELLKQFGAEIIYLDE